MRNSCWAAGDRYYINLFWIDVGRVPRVYAPTKYLQRHSVYFIWSRWWNFAFLNLNSSKVAKRFLAEMFSQRGISHPKRFVEQVSDCSIWSMMNLNVFLHVDLHVWICARGFACQIIRFDQTRPDDTRQTKIYPRIVLIFWGLREDGNG